MHEFLCLITKSNTTFHELSKSYMIDAILSQIEGENSKYIFGPSSSVMTVDNAVASKTNEWIKTVIFLHTRIFF